MVGLRLLPVCSKIPCPGQKDACGSALASDVISCSLHFRRLAVACVESPAMAVAKNSRACRRTSKPLGRVEFAWFLAEIDVSAMATSLSVSCLCTGNACVKDYMHVCTRTLAMHDLKMTDKLDKYSSAAADRPREPLSQLKSCQLLHNCTKITF